MFGKDSSYTHIVITNMICLGYFDKIIADAMDEI